MVFDDEFSTVTFMRESTIPPNCTDIMQRIPKRGEPENIYFKDTWFTTDLEEYPSKPPSHDPGVAPENNNKTLTWYQSELYVNKLWPSRELLKGTNVQLLRKFEEHQI